ncbi:hypothetical protein MYX07_00365 [Patescibacteria group bacterium AH-259-L07]|nr:hypothetical protein [Patescibacteria group bacterium AH-259-L07]
MALSNFGEQFAVNVLRKFYRVAVAPMITNADYEGDIKKGGDRLNILSFLGDVTWNDYTVGTDMTVQALADTEDQLVIDQKKYYNFDIDDVDKQFTYVDDQDSTLIENAADQLGKKIDTLVLALHTQVKAGHRIGTDYTTGTIAVDSAGVVTGTSTVFTSAMVGLGFSPDAGVTWYRISVFTSTTSITVTDWDDTAYSGGVVSGGTSYIIEANTVFTVTKTTIYQYIVQLGELLTEDDIPEHSRWLVLPPKIATLVRQSPDLTPAVDRAYDEVVLNGHLGMIAGFSVYESNQVAGDNSAGFRCLAGHIGFITFAKAFTESRVKEAEKQFALLYQGLCLYGAKVAIERRKAGAYLFANR